MKLKKVCVMLVCLLVGITCVSLDNVYASNDVVQSSEIAPSEKDIVNGIETDNETMVHMKDVISEPIFYSYKPKVKKHIKKFKIIGTYRLENKTSKTQKQSAKVTKSSMKGSEWNGNISFSAKIKTGIIGKMETTVGVGLKQKRSKNEAVGYSTSMHVSPQSIGTIKVYYSGWKSSGELKTYTIFTANPNNRVYKTTDVNATVYQSKGMDIYTSMSEKKI